MCIYAWAVFGHGAAEPFYGFKFVTHMFQKTVGTIVFSAKLYPQNPSPEKKK